MPSLIEPVLICAAHPDDEVLGCGGAIARHAAMGHRVHIVILAQGVHSRDGAASSALNDLRAAGRAAAAALGATSIEFGDFPDNRMDEVARLDVAKVVEAAIDRYKPGLVYTHHPADLNVDHVRVHEAVSVACRPVPGHPVRELRFFEVASSSEWRPPAGGPVFAPNLFVDISAHLEQKLQALRAYSAEMRPWPHARSLEAVEHLARWRGASAGLHAAEAFVIGRRIETADGEAR